MYIYERTEKTFIRRSRTTQSFCTCRAESQHKLIILADDSVPISVNIAIYEDVTQPHRWRRLGCRECRGLFWEGWSDYDESHNGVSDVFNQTLAVHFTPLWLWLQTLAVWLNVWIKQPRIRIGNQLRWLAMYPIIYVCFTTILCFTFIVALKEP